MISREGNIIVAKFTEGNIIENLKKLMEDVGADSAVILNGIGMLEGAVIGYFDGEKYIEEKIEEPAELVSLQGNIGKSEDEYIIHAHVALATSDHMLKGGHLLGGRVKVVNEIVVLILEKMKIRRVKRGKLLEMEVE